MLMGFWSGVLYCLEMGARCNKQTIDEEEMVIEIENAGMAVKKVKFASLQKRSRKEEFHHVWTRQWTYI